MRIIHLKLLLYGNYGGAISIGSRKKSREFYHYRGFLARIMIKLGLLFAAREAFFCP